MKLIGTAILFLLLGTPTVFFSSAEEHLPQNQSHLQAQEPIVVMIEKMHGRLSYKIESKSIEDPLIPLSELLAQRGQNCPVIVILPWNATFQEEMDVEVVASKAGFKTVRSFLYNPHRGFMRELKWGLDIPFTTNPPLG